MTEKKIQISHFSFLDNTVKSMDPKSPTNLTQTTAIGGLNKKSPEQWRIEGVKLINGDVLVDPLLKSCDRLKRKSCRYDKDRSSKRRCLESANDGVSGEFSHDGVFYKPWLDSLGEDKDLSSSYQSQDVVNGTHRSTKPQIQKEPEMHPKMPQPFLEIGITDAGEKTRRSKKPPSGKIHKCPICHIVFLTGQALGGHKRRHYKGEKYNHSEVILSSDGEKSSQNNESVVTNVLKTEERPRSLLLIDLNEPPLPECGNNAVFYKPWVEDSLCGKEDVSYSYPPEDVVASLMYTQPQTQPKIDSCDCNVCGKDFTSYYDLGGHMTIHLVKPPQPILENGIRDVVEKTRRPKKPPSGKIHKCPICHIVFPTGQALGGHKRRHYKGGVRGEKHNYSQVILSTDGESGGDKSSQSNGSVVTKVLETEERQRSLIWIDLYEQPLPEIDETTVEPWMSLKME